MLHVILNNNPDKEALDGSFEYQARSPWNPYKTFCTNIDNKLNY